MESPLSKDYFDLFGLPVKYQVDVTTLTERYKDLQHTMHPDKFVSASENDKGLSIRMTAHVNDAYETIKNPLLRARYLLQTHGVDVDEGRSALSAEFLGEQIELREQLGEIRGSENPSNEITGMRNVLERHINHIQEQLQERFSLNTAQALEQARALYHEMQFMYRLQEEVDEMEDELII